jgi:gliding motility-associated-like protein
MVSAAYTAIATNAPGCSDTASLTVNVKPFAVTLTATPDPILSGTMVTLNTSANFAYQVITWEPQSDFFDQTALTQTFLVRDTSRIFSVIALSAQGCLDTATLAVNVDVNTGDLFIPNAFTPNNDGKNDVFKVYGASVKGVEMRVFNQWGNLIFESHDPLRGWDGNIGGHPQPVGIYLYAIKITFYNDKTINKKGTVSLIR